MNKTLYTAAAAVAMLGSWASAGTVNLVSNGAASTSDLGAFTGSISYDDVSTLTITLQNTTPAGGGYITGFLFNIDGDSIANLTPNPTGSFLDLETTGNLSGSPFGEYEAGAALGGNFLGGGSPTGGIAVGSEGTFSFTVTGPDASSLRVDDFLSLNDGNREAAFLVRFRGLNIDEGSDKVPGIGIPDDGGSTPIPLPAAAWSAMTVFGFLGGKSLRRRFARAGRA